MKESESIELKRSLAELKDGLNAIDETPQVTPTSHPASNAARVTARVTARVAGTLEKRA